MNRNQSWSNLTDKEKNKNENSNSIMWWLSTKTSPELSSCFNKNLEWSKKVSYTNNIDVLKKTIVDLENDNKELKEKILKLEDDNKKVNEILFKCDKILSYLEK